jgi:hypothetical protein
MNLETATCHMHNRQPVKKIFLNCFGIKQLAIIISISMIKKSNNESYHDDIFNIFTKYNENIVMVRSMRPTN